VSTTEKRNAVWSFTRRRSTSKRKESSSRCSRIKDAPAGCQIKGANHQGPSGLAQRMEDDLRVFKARLRGVDRQHTEVSLVFFRRELAVQFPTPQLQQVAPSPARLGQVVIVDD